jgi:hypothetical protein
MHGYGAHQRCPRNERQRRPDNDIIALRNTGDEEKFPKPGMVESIVEHQRLWIVFARPRSHTHDAWYERLPLNVHVPRVIRDDRIIGVGVAHKFVDAGAEKTHRAFCVNVAVQCGEGRLTPMRLTDHLDEIRVITVRVRQQRQHVREFVVLLEILTNPFLLAARYGGLPVFGRDKGPKQPYGFLTVRGIGKKLGSRVPSAVP